MRKYSAILFPIICISLFILLSVSAMQVRDTHQNSTWCWIISDTNTAPGAACTGAEMDALKEDDAGTVSMGTRNGDPIHFNSTHNQTQMPVGTSISNVDICAMFNSYTVDSPACTFRYLEKNSSGTYWQTLPTTAFGGTCPPATGSLYCYDIGPESGGQDYIDSVDEAENLSFYLYDVDASGTAEYVDIGTLFFNISYTDATSPAAELGLSPGHGNLSRSKSMTFDLRCSDNSELHYAELWSNWTDGVWKANVTNATTVNGSYWNVTVDGIPEGFWVWGARCNDTYGNEARSENRTFTMDAVYINVELVKPPASALVAKDFVFNVNSTVKCIGGSCGNVDAKLRYNATTDFPDTDVPTSEGPPMYIIDSPNQQSCFYNPLDSGEWCNITWKVKATGNIGDNYKLGAVFASDSPDVIENQTENHTVEIVSCVVDIGLHWNAIEFGSSDPGTVKAAPGNINSIYNISSDSTCNVDLYIKGSNLTGIDYPDYNITVDKIVWSNLSNDYATGLKLDFGWLPVNKSVWPGTNNTQYFWMDVPWEVMAGAYEGNITIEGVENGLSP